MLQLQASSILAIRNFIFVLITISMISSCAMFQPDRIGRGAAKQVDETIDELTSEERLKAITKSAVEGAISGLSSKESDEEMSKLSIALSETLGEKLNEVFENLDTRTPGIKFAKGVTDSLISKEVERQVTSFLSGVIHDTGGDINMELDLLTKNINESIGSLIPNLNKQIASIDGSIEKILSTKLKDSLSYFLSDALGNVELEEFSHKLSTELLSVELRDTLKTMASEIAREINLTEDVPGFLEVIKRYGYQFMAIAFFLIAALIYFWSKLKQRDDYERHVAEALGKMMDEDPALRTKLENKLLEKDRLKLFQDQLRKRGND